MEVRVKQGIKERIREIMDEAEKRFKFTRDDLLAFYRDIIITPVGQVNEHSPLAQEVSTSTAGEMVTRKIRMVGKIDAAREIARMLGWYEPEKVQVSGTLGGLRGRLTGDRQ